MYGSWIRSRARRHSKKSAVSASFRKNSIALLLYGGLRYEKKKDEHVLRTMRTIALDLLKEKKTKT